MAGCLVRAQLVWSPVLRLNSPALCHDDTPSPRATGSRPPPVLRQALTSHSRAVRSAQPVARVLPSGTVGSHPQGRRPTAVRLCPARRPRCAVARRALATAGALTPGFAAVFDDPRPPRGVMSAAIGRRTNFSASRTPPIRTVDAARPGPGSGIGEPGCLCSRKPQPRSRTPFGMVLRKMMDDPGVSVKELAMRTSVFHQVAITGVRRAGSSDGEAV